MSSFHFLNSVQPPQVTSLNLPPNVACVLYKKEMIKVEPTELPILQPDGVMVKVMATGEYDSVVVDTTRRACELCPPRVSPMSSH